MYSNLKQAGSTPGAQTWPTDHGLSTTTGGQPPDDMLLHHKLGRTHVGIAPENVQERLLCIFERVSIQLPSSRWRLL